MVIDMVSKCAPNIILCGHVKDVSLNEGLDGSVKDLDLTGKVKRILGSTKTLLETAKATELPVSLVKAVRAFYGQEPLVDAVQPE